MIAEPTHDTTRASAPVTDHERSMLVVELAVAGLTLLASLMLSLAR